MENERRLEEVDINVVEEARRVLRIEAQSILDLIERIDDDFSRAVEILYQFK